MSDPWIRSRGPRTEDIFRDFTCWSRQGSGPGQKEAVGNFEQFCHKATNVLPLWFMDMFLFFRLPVFIVKGALFPEHKLMEVVLLFLKEQGWKVTLSWWMPQSASSAPKPGPLLLGSPLFYNHGLQNSWAPDALNKTPICPQSTFSHFFNSSFKSSPPL